MAWWAWMLVGTGCFAVLLLGYCCLAIAGMSDREMDRLGPIDEEDAA